jgi:hypothetical protein
MVEVPVWLQDSRPTEMSERKAKIRRVRITLLKNRDCLASILDDVAADLY